MPHPREGFSNPTTGTEKMTMPGWGKGGGGLGWARLGAFRVLTRLLLSHNWSLLHSRSLCRHAKDEKERSVVWRQKNGCEAKNSVPRTDLGVSRGFLDHHFCLKFRISFSRILSKIKSIYIAGKCPGRPPLSKFSGSAPECFTSLLRRGLFAL